MLSHLGRRLVRHRRRVLIAAGVVLIAMTLLATGTFDRLKNGGFDDPASDSSRAEVVAEREFGGADNLVLLISPRKGVSMDDPAVRISALRITRALATRSDVAQVRSYWIGGSPSLRARDGSSGLITMHVTGDAAASKNSAEAIIQNAATGDAVIEVRAGGRLGIGRDLESALTRSLTLAEGIAVPLTLLLMIWAFGSVRAALIPLAVGLFATVGTFAELAVLGRITDVSSYTVNLTTALALGLGVDYALLMVTRFREELLNVDSVAVAVSRTMSTAGRTILFSAATVAAALSALLLFPGYFLRSIAYAGIGVVLIAMLSSLVILPVLLAVSGRKLLRTGKWRRNEASETAFWRRVAIGVMRRPLPVVLGLTAVLLIVGSPIVRVTLGSPDDRALHTSASSRQVGDNLRAQYDSSAASAISVVVQGNVATEQFAAFTETVRTLPGVTFIATDKSKPGVALLSVYGPQDPGSAASRDIVNGIRGIAPPGDAVVLVGGSAAVLLDGKAAITQTLPWALIWILLTTFVLLFLFTGSVVLPVKALVLNALSLTAVFGILVWIFQYGNLSSLLQFTPTPLNTSMIVLMFCISFGLSMDYEVFLLGRIYEAHNQGADDVDAVATGLSHTGPVVTTAAALLSITFLALVPAQISFLQLFGLGTGIAITLDATVVRGLLVPAIMRLTSGVNWWAPKPLAALHRRIGLADHTNP